VSGEVASFRDEVRARGRADIAPVDRTGWVTAGDGRGRGGLASVYCSSNRALISSTA
jgi:hypothetical protein